MRDHNFEFIQRVAITSSPETSRKVELSLLNFVYRQAKVGFVASIFCACVIFLGMYDHSQNPILMGWFTFFIIIQVLRYALVTSYLRTPEPEHKYDLWRNLFIAGAMFAGLSWGLTGLLFAHASSLEQTLIIFVVAGTTAGAVPVLCGDLASAIGFLVPALLPQFIFFILLRSEIPVLFDLTILAYLAFLISLSFKSNSLVRNSIALQYENSALLDNLSEAKEQLEASNEKLAQAAMHDPLTNVANRNLFTANFSVAIDRACENKKMLALLYIDLDNFKDINDIHGHYVGDQLLLRIIDRLEYVCKKNDIISRLGGDEFTIILENIDNVREVADITDRLCHAIAAPTKIDDLQIKTSASIGVSLYPIDGKDPDLLLNIADRSMYHVKQRGGNNFLFNADILME